MYCVTLIAASDYDMLAHDAEAALRVLSHAELRWLKDGVACDILCEEAPDNALLATIIDHKPLDYCVQSAAHRRKKLLISDMDSTIIGQECIDELADLQGLGAQVSAITEAAMRGQLDFSASLTQRVALLKDLPVAALDEVWQHRICLNKGAASLVQTMRAHGAFTMLVSGGFTFFTEKVAEICGFDAHHANQLHHKDGVLSGLVIPPILHSGTKAEYLLKACALRGVAIRDTLAVGDGANDAEMIEAASLGVAYYAKPLLQSKADAAINHTDLTSLLYFQGYHEDEIIKDEPNA